MKKIILSLGFFALMTSCSGDDNNQQVDSPSNGSEFATENPANPNGGENKVLLLKVDLTTNVFEGGKELTFETANTFTIQSGYHAPADFGMVYLQYSELDAPIFEGGIVWSGLGEMSFPEALDMPDTFETTAVGLPQPELSAFETVTYAVDGEADLDPDHQAIWEAIHDLEIVKEYRESNPEAKISLFLYAPSVGIGNPAEWDWFVILKN